MNDSFIAMLTAINEPQAIERAYQIFAAKRELLAHEADTKAGYKLHPSFEDIASYLGKKGEFVLRMHGLPVPVSAEGFRNGQLFELMAEGRESSTVKLMGRISERPSQHTVIIHNKHLESVFRFQCGCINKCRCSACD